MVCKTVDPFSMPKKKGRAARNKHEDEDDKFDMGNVKDSVDEVEG